MNRKAGAIACPMVEAVKHPGVIVVFSLQDLGAGSAKLISKWREVCVCASYWGGKILIKLPSNSKAWEDNLVFSKFCLDYDLVLVHRLDEEVAFATNCKVTRWALHGGDWRLTRGAEEAKRITWAEATWGDDALLSEIEVLLAEEEEHLNKKCAPAKSSDGPKPKSSDGPNSKSSDGHEPNSCEGASHCRPLSMNINGVTAPAMSLWSHKNTEKSYPTRISDCHWL